MNIFIDGFQNVGKTTLLDNSKYKHLRFPFDVYVHDFDLKDPQSLNGFQLGKDLGMLFGLSVTDNRNITLFDRGPFSTIYYSLKEDRWTKRKYVENFLKHIKSFKDNIFVFVTKINDETNIKREHNDGFDYLDDDNEKSKDYYLGYLQGIANLHEIDLRFFENDFSKPIEENIERFNNFLEQVMYEHNRD